MSTDSGRSVQAPSAGALMAIAAVAVGAAVMTVAGEWRLGLILLAVAPVGALLWARPALALVSLVALSCSVDYLTEELPLLPHVASYALEGLIVVLVLQALVRRAGRGFVGLGIEWPLGLLVALLVCSIAVNQVDAYRVLLGGRVLFRFIVAAYAIVALSFDARLQRRVVQLVLLVVTLQIPVAFYQWAVIGRTDDQVFGTVRSTGVLVLLVIIALAILVARFLRERARIRHLLAAFGLFTLPLLGEAKAFFLLFPFTLLVLFRAELGRRPLRVLAVAVPIGIGLLVALASYGNVPGNADLLQLFRQPVSVGALLGRDPIAGALGNPADVTIAASVGPRLESLRHAANSVQRTPWTILAGHGLGARTVTHAEVVAQSSSILYVSPVATRLYELGYLGLALYWITLMTLARRVSRSPRSASAYWRALRFAFPAVVAVYLVADFYTDTLYDSAACVFWILAAVLVAQARDEEGSRVRSGAVGVQ